LDVDLLEPTALRLGIRMASLDRPGFGGSDYHDFTFASHARDVAALADLLDADRFHVFGQSAGGPYALACAALLDARVISVGVGGSGVPFVEGTTWHAALSEQEREGLSLVGIDD
jgi:pimeloyl-ACP methyl ester carboxylesterase